MEIKVRYNLGSGMITRAAEHGPGIATYSQAERSLAIACLWITHCNEIL